MFIPPFHWKDADPFRRVGYLALLNAFYDAKSNWGACIGFEICPHFGLCYIFHYSIQSVQSKFYVFVYLRYLIPTLILIIETKIKL